MDELHRKYAALTEYLEGLGSAVIAFSGGVDSTFLLAAAKEALGGRVTAVTAQSASFPKRELDEAARFCRTLGVPQRTFISDELSIEGFRRNPPDRCYICKKAIFGELLKIAEELGAAAVCEGSNIDDEGDYRPGLRAIAELGVKSPLREAGLTKAEIRALSKEMELPTHSKPSFACLATRFPYGEEITAEKLAMTERAEQLLSECGFTQYRVRIHGTSARIELLPEEFPKLMELRREITAGFKEYGFTYVSLDLEGYRMGSMNETLKL